MLTETWRELQRVFQPLISSKSEQEHRLDLYGGGVIDCWSLETPDAARGRRYKTIVIDEAAMVRDLQQAWQRVIRPTLTDYKGNAWFLSTPRGVNDFHALYLYAQQGALDWASWQMPTSTNPYIDPEELESAKRDLGPLAYAQEYGADFTALGDAGFPEVQAATHVVPTDYEMIRGWRRVAGHDWGYSSPAAQNWWAIDPKGGAVCYREWSARKMQPDEIAQTVLYLTGDETPIVYGDPQMWKPSGKAYLTQDMINTLAEAGKLELVIAKQYEQAGLHMTPANNARIPGKLRLHTLFGKRAEDGIPYLRFMDCCPDTFATFQNLQLDPDRQEDVLTDYPSDDPVWRRDEYYDCTRYAIMSIPTKATEPVDYRARRPQWNW